MFHAGVDSGRAMARLQRSKLSWRLGLCCLAIVLLTLAVPVRSSHAAKIRLALVVGNDEYKSGKLTTPANDAGLVADALTAAGFTVIGARNLDQATLRDSFREFLGQVAMAGPDAVTVVYLAGFGVQFAGENYFVPVDADLARDVDVPLQALRVSDFMQPLAALPGRVKIVILSAAKSLRARRRTDGERAGACRSGQRRGDRFQRGAGHGRAGRARALRRVCDLADGNDRCRRAQPRRPVRAHAIARQRTD
jgi:hypothetical protein